MSPQEARQRADEIVAGLADPAGDPEHWHSEADTFVAQVLTDILASELAPWVRMMAEQAHRVATAPGERWFA